MNPANQAGAQASWSPETFPDPRVDRERCGRSEAGWICDPDWIFPREFHDQVQALITSISTECRHPCNGGEAGYQVAVAILNLLDGTVLGADNSQAVEKFATVLYQRWRLDQSGCDDGVLLLYVKSIRSVYIRSGNGTQDVLTPRVMRIIYARAFGKESAEKAIIIALKLMRDAFQGKGTSMVIKWGTKRAFIWFEKHLIEFVLLVLFFIAPPFCVALYVLSRCLGWFLLVFVDHGRPQVYERGGQVYEILRPFVRCMCLFWDALMAVAHTWRKKRRAQKLGRIQRELEGLQQNAGFVRMCPICLKDLPDPIETPAAATPLMASNVQRLGCSHRYHKACLRGWWEHPEALICPLCRETINLEDMNGPHGPNQTYRAWASNVQRLGCSYRNHTACRRGWLEHPEALICPLCRETINLEDMNGPHGPNQTYRAWLRYYLSRLYSQSQMPVADIEAHVDHLMARRGTDWAETGFPDAMV